MAGRAQVHDASGRAAPERGQQEARQQEVSEVVGAELELEAVGGLLALARHHHAGIVQQQIEAVEPIGERGREIADGAQVGEVKQHQLEAGLGRRLLSFTLDDPDALPLGDEPIFRAGACVGQITSAAFGHTLGRAVALGYARRDGEADEAVVEDGGFEIEIAGERFAATASLDAPYDPKGERARG